MYGLLVYFWTPYVFSIPDNVWCFAGPNDDFASNIISDVTPTNVSLRFHRYFIMNYSFFCFAILIALVQLTAHFMKSSKLYGSFQWFNMLNCCYFICTGFVGSVFRWSYEGRVCSGNYLPEDADDETKSVYLWESGAFMQKWLVVSYLVTFFGFCFCCIIGCLGFTGHFDEQ